MLWLIIIGIIALGIYYSNLGGTPPRTIDTVQPSPVITKIVTGQSGPARRPDLGPDDLPLVGSFGQSGPVRKPTIAAPPVVPSAPRIYVEPADSNFYVKPTRPGNEELLY